LKFVGLSIASGTWASHWTIR